MNYDNAFYLTIGLKNNHDRLGYAKNGIRYQCEDLTTSITISYYF